MRRRGREETMEKVLDVDATMQGTLTFRDPVNLRINGSFEGNLDTKGNLTIGENATVRFNSVLVAAPHSAMDVGSRVFLDAERSRTEIVSRAITTGGRIVARGYIEGNAPDVKGHLECRGLILEEKGLIHAIPELKGTLAGIDLSHEAAVGKIAEEEVEYLMTRGLTRAEATATIVRGFLRVEIEGLPPMLNAELQRAIEASEEDLM